MSFRAEWERDAYRIMGNAEATELFVERLLAALEAGPPGAWTLGTLAAEMGRAIRHEVPPGAIQGNATELIALTCANIALRGTGGEAGPQGDMQRQEWERKAWNAGSAAQFARTQKAIDRLEAEIAALRDPSPPDYAALAEAYLNERVLVETIPCKRLALVRDFAKWLGVRGESVPPLPDSTPRLPDTLIERVIQVAHRMAEPNADATVMLTAFEAGYIRGYLRVPPQEKANT